MTLVGDPAYQDYLAEHHLTATGFTPLELLACAVAREIPDGAFAFVGTGLPLLAATLAQKTTAPSLTIILEAGTVGPYITDLPISVADPRAAFQAATLGTLADAFGTIAARGFCSLGVLGAAECDQYGNLNSTAIGGYWPAGVSDTGRGPAVRLTGSGGANSIAALADKIIVMMVHEKRRFPPRVGYLTTVAGRRGPAGETRFDYGLFRGGELKVITDLCTLRPDPVTGILVLDELFPGVTAAQVQANTGWELDISAARPFPPPTVEELRVLRLEVDPQRFYLGRAKKR